MEEHPGGTDHDKKERKADDNLLRRRHAGNIVIIARVAQYHLLTKGEMVGVDNRLFSDWGGTGRGPCGRGLRGALGLRGFRRLGALALGTQGLELGAFLACTLLFLAAGFLGAQGLKLGAFIIA